MKNKIYNISHICFLMLISCFLLGSCMSDTINLDPDKIQEEELDKDNLWGSYLTTMQRRVVPEDVNLFQRSEDLFGNMYSGYFAGTQNWGGGANGTTYAISDEWKDAPFKSAFVEFLSSWNILRQKVDSTSVLFAVGEIVKVEAMHKATDMYGPLPYLKFGLTNPVHYDSQQAIYESFFKELDHAIDILVKFDQANPSSKALVKFDLIFNSNIPNWIRFANSLKLRLAMRISAVYEDAQKIAEAAVAHPYGVIESNDNNPTMQSNSNLSFTYNNPIHSISSAEGYEEDVMGATMDAYLNGFEDPRRAVFFALSSNGNYRGLRNGHKNGDIFKGDEGLSKPNIQQGTPYIWMTAAEVFFLRAEGALKQWDMKGTPEALCIRPTGRTGSPYRRRRHTVCFGASAQQKSALRRPNRLSASASLLFAGCPLYSTTPRSLQRRTGGLLLDRSFQYALPLAFLRYRPDAGETGELRGLPIHKTSVHADVCSGCYQNSILVWLIIVRCVSSLGSSGVSRFEEFLDSERCRDDWESLS